MEDSDLLHEIWNGKLPVEFSLAADEVITLDQPKPVYLLVPRVNYFPVVSEKAKRYFISYIDQSQAQEMWFEYDRIPLKWHYPIGVLFDVLVSSDECLPWQITVHFKNFPEDALMSAKNLDAVETAFMQVVKEADQLKHRGNVINSMQRKDHKQLWNGLINDRFEQFWTVNRRLMENCGEDAIKYIPFRLYLPRNSPDPTNSPPNAIAPIFMQRLCEPFRSSDEAENGSKMAENGAKMTLGDLMRKFAGEFSDSSKFRVISHGILVPFETPMLYMCLNLHYPDNFLHLCIVPVEKPAPPVR